MQMENARLDRLAQHRTEYALRANASRVCVALGCIVRGPWVRQHRPNLSRVPQHRLILCEPGETKGERPVIGRETNVDRHNSSFAELNHSEA
jgi:hypothetical protein